MGQRDVKWNLGRVEEGKHSSRTQPQWSRGKGGSNVVGESRGGNREFPGPATGTRGVEGAGRGRGGKT